MLTTAKLIAPNPAMRYAAEVLNQVRAAVDEILALTRPARFSI